MSSISPTDTLSGVYDMLVIGAGPGGLQAALSAAFEGMRVCIVADRMGGQSRSSGLIENVAGFGNATSGLHLCEQTLEAVLRMKVPGTYYQGRVVELDNPDKFLFRAYVEDGAEIEAHSVVLATGLSWRKLQIPGGDLITYADGVDPRVLFHSLNRPRQDIAIIGGGNSAAQAALVAHDLLQRQGSNVGVKLFVRRDNLRTTMSREMWERLEALAKDEDSDSFDIYYENEPKEVLRDPGDNQLKLRTNKNTWGEWFSHIYAFLGAAPNTRWLKTLVDYADDGSVLTLPGTLVTATPGLFAIGDVRAGSTYRVPNAMGDGANVVPQVAKWLADNRGIPQNKRRIVGSVFA